MARPNTDPLTFDALLRTIDAPHVQARMKAGRGRDIELNEGSYGKVYKGVLLDKKGQPTSEEVAIKVLRNTDNALKLSDMFRRLKREISVWKQIGSHDNIVPLLGIIPMHEAQTLWIVMPLMAEGDLTMYLANHPNDTVDRCSLIRGVAHGLSHIHGKSLVHGDVKANNIFVDAAGKVYLGDFGMSGRAGTVVSRTLQNGGAIGWMAPERLDPKRFGIDANAARSPASDIFSFGMTIYEIMTGHVPYHEAANQGQVWTQILNGDRPAHPGEEAEARGLSPSLWKYVQFSWQPVRDRRPSLELLIKVLDGVVTLSAAMEEPVIEGTALENGQSAKNFYAPLLKTNSIPVLHATAGFPDVVLGVRHGVVSDVAPGTLSADGRLIAIKTLRLLEGHNAELYKELLLRMNAVKHLSHPNILDVVGVQTFSIDNIACFSLLYDYMRNGDLIRFLKEHPTADRAVLLYGIEDGLNYLHSMGVVHSDLLPRNILVTDDLQAVLRPISVSAGIGHHLGEELSSMVGASRESYMPPEVFDKVGYNRTPTKEGDMYTLGVTIYRMFYGEVPYPTLSGAELRQELSRGVWPSRQPVEGMTDALQRLVQRCWKEKSERPTISEFVNLPRKKEP